MKNKWVLSLGAALVLIPIVAFADAGIVVRHESGCSFYVVKTEQGFVVLNWYGGKDPDEGDTIVGDLEHYGLKTVHNVTQDERMRVFVEAHGRSEDDAMERMEKKCAER